MKTAIVAPALDELDEEVLEALRDAEYIKSVKGRGRTVCEQLGFANDMNSEVMRSLRALCRIGRVQVRDMHGRNLISKSGSLHSVPEGMIFRPCEGEDVT